MHELLLVFVRMWWESDCYPTWRETRTRRWGLLFSFWFLAFVDGIDLSRTWIRSGAANGLAGKQQ